MLYRAAPSPSESQRFQASPADGAPRPHLLSSHRSEHDDGLERQLFLQHIQSLLLLFVQLVQQPKLAERRGRPLLILGGACCCHSLVQGHVQLPRREDLRDMGPSTTPTTPSCLAFIPLHRESTRASSRGRCTHTRERREWDRERKH